MTRDEMKQATALAQNQDVSLIDEDITIFDGFGLQGFAPVNCTIRQVARLIRWQALQMNGALNAEAYDEVAQVARRKFMICG